MQGVEEGNLYVHDCGVRVIKIQERARMILNLLEQRYPEVKVPLHHRNPFQLLIATILSAQCTDATVNKVTPRLFERFPDAESLAAADSSQVEALIHPTGFYRHKARSIQETSHLIVTRFGGEVPRTLPELVTLAGVGRKTANVLLSAAELEGWEGWDAAAGGLGVVVDTHVLRLSRRLGLTTSADPEKVERDLQAIFSREEWASLPLRLIYFGREVCTARRPRCPECPLLPYCPAGRHGGATTSN